MSREWRTGRSGSDVQQKLREAVTPRPDPAFAAHLRQEFVRDASAKASAPIVSLKPRRSGQALLVGALAMAAALAVVWTANRGPSWGVHATTGSGAIRMDEWAVDAADRAGVMRRLHPGVAIEVPENAQLDLELPGIALFQVTGGTRMVLPASPGRWFGRAVSGRVEAGELRIATGPGFRGSNLTFVTATAEVRITGTTLAILAPPEGACVCVFEGRAEMRDSVHGMAPVIEGTRRVVFRDARAPLTEPIRPMESAKLGMLREEAARTLGSNSIGHIPD